MSNNNKNILYCSFCGKSQHEVRKLIAGPTVFICDECVELCMDIIKEENKDKYLAIGESDRMTLLFKKLESSSISRPPDMIILLSIPIDESC